MLIRHLDELGSIDSPRATIGVITTPAAVAQEVADRLVAAGIRAILNFAPAFVSVPDHVTLRKVDLTLELQVLNFYQQRHSSTPAAETA